MKLAVNRYQHKEPYTCIAGYAGSGKSTLVNFIIKALDIPEDKIAAANKEIIDLLNIEQEVAIRTVKFEDIPEDLSLTTGQMEAIIFMVD